MNIFARLRLLPLGKQVALCCVVLTLATTAIMAVILTAFDARRVNADLDARSGQYVRQLHTASAAAVVANNGGPVRKVFKSVSADGDIEGLGLYDAAGQLLEGLGRFPPSVTPGAVFKESNNQRIVVVSTVETTADGPHGTLYIDISKQRIQANNRVATLIAAVTAIVLLLLALVPAMLISRLLSRRLAPVVNVAMGIAAGNFEHPRIAVSTRDEVGTVARAMNKMVAELNRVLEERRQLALTEQVRLEQQVRERTQDLEESREQFRQIAESTNGIAFRLNLTRGCFEYIGPQGPARLGFPAPQWDQDGFLDLLLPRSRCAPVRTQFDTCSAGSFEVECSVQTPQGAVVELRWVANCQTTEDGKYLRGLMLDITRQRRLESDLLNAQKLESVGRLAAGVAHEINTPVQYVNDSIYFLRDALSDTFSVVKTLQEVRRLAAAGAPDAELRAAIASADACETEVDLTYLQNNVPPALERCVDGLDRVGSIVSSMKEFAHPAQREMAPVDLNRAIKNTLTIAANEYKYVAEIETDLGELPPVTCFINDMNQTFLNIIVNAAHAIADRVAGSDGKGKITITTRQEGDDVLISIADTGGGIPDNVIKHIFDPFFTTKAVGKGTGQGLALVWDFVKNKHGGDIRVESRAGDGATFFIRVPIGGMPAPVEQLSAA